MADELLSRRKVESHDRLDMKPNIRQLYGSGFAQIQQLVADWAMLTIMSERGIGLIMMLRGVFIYVELDLAVVF